MLCSSSSSAKATDTSPRQCGSSALLFREIGSVDQQRDQVSHKTGSHDIDSFSRVLRDFTKRETVTVLVAFRVQPVSAYAVIVSEPDLPRLDLSHEGLAPQG